MKRAITGALIFLSGLFVGIHVTAFVTNVTAQFSLPADIPVREFNDDTDWVANTPPGIRVSYIGINESTLRFLIYNGSTKKLSCHGYSGMCASPELRVNGLDANAWVCMNGSSIYGIMPGDTVEMMVSPEDFDKVPGKNHKVMVGYRSIDNDTQDYYFAEPILLPPAFRNEIHKSLSKWDE